MPVWEPAMYANIATPAALIGDPILLKELVALREWWDVDHELLDDAIRACSPAPTHAR